MSTLGKNIVFPIYGKDGMPFHGLVLHKPTVDSVVMSLGDKITGDVYYKDTTLAVSMQEYIEYKRDPDNAKEDAVKYVLVNPPTIVREGMVSDNSELKGMTKYSFTFYHPMYQLSNLPFSDVAVSSDEEKYLSQNKTFSWIGYIPDYIAKLNKNLQGTEWVVVLSGKVTDDKLKTLSEVLSFDNATIADALKTSYETWEVPFVIDTLHKGEYSYVNTNNKTVDYYDEGKRFVILFGLPSNEIYANDEDAKNGRPFVFKFGQGVGLKNNSATPKNNKIVTRIAGYGSEDNIPYGYPQIEWVGDQTWDYTIDNDSTNPNSYPIYSGILGGRNVRLIKHPFTRTHLMPSIFSETVNKKVNPFADGYDPDTTIIDYYDAIGEKYPNRINLIAPSYEMHEFEKIKPELGEAHIVSAIPYNTDEDPKAQEAGGGKDYYTYEEFTSEILRIANGTNLPQERQAHQNLHDSIEYSLAHGGKEGQDRDYWATYNYAWEYTIGDVFIHVKYTSTEHNGEWTVLKPNADAIPEWNDEMDDDGNYLQSYFKITLPKLSFDLYACAAITQEMSINMRGGACIGCTFPVQVDWEDYKKNFYDEDGNFSPYGEQRDLDKYPDSRQGEITVIVQKDNTTFGTLMPDIYRQPKANDKFVILGISLPASYISGAEARLDDAMREYMLENNAHYYDYPLKFDEHFLANRTNILLQIRNNTILRFEFGSLHLALYVKQITIKYGANVLPQYDITLTDDVEIVLNQIGKVTDDVSRMRVQVNDLAKWYDRNFEAELGNKLSRVADDVALGRITFQEGLEAIGGAIFDSEIKSRGFASGLYGGRGWRIDALGNGEFESVRVRSVFEVVQLLVNRQQGQEGDTLYSDNDQIEYVEKVGDNYILTLKEKWDGYITAQQYGNILKGIINTLAAKAAGVSDVSTATETDGSNPYYTSWMRVVGTRETDKSLAVNQIRVVLYGDDDVPAQKNFEPCELMVVGRWGCVDYSEQYRGTDTYEAVKASIRRRQTSFYISASEGRIVKLVGVASPILAEGNYGTTLGVIPDFIKSWDSWARLVNEHPHLEDRDYLYAQGIIYNDLVHVDINGVPIPQIVYQGDWVAETAYYNNKWNATTQQFETHEVRHNNGRWRCLQSQPVVVDGVATYHEPRWGSQYWQLVDGNGNYTIDFVSTNGDKFRQGYVSTTITPFLFFGNVDISSDVPLSQWSWSRATENGTGAGDAAWSANHQGVRTLALSNADMPTAWSRNNKAVFTVTAKVNDGSNTIIVQNQVIA